MNADLRSEPLSVAARTMIDRLIAFNTVSRDSNLGLIEWVRDYLHHHGAKTRLTHDATGKKANLFATLGESSKPGLILSGHTDVVPVDGQNWDTDPFVATERDGKLYARGSADMKGFIGIILNQAPQFVAALNGNRLDAPLHYALSYDEEVGCLGVLARDVKTGHQKIVQLQSAVDVRDEDVEKMVAESVEYAFDDLAQRQWIETKRKSGDMLGATRKALAQVGALIVPAEVKEIEALMHNVEHALESQNLAELKAANAKLDEGTQALADLVMDLAMEAQLRKKGLLDEPAAAPDPVLKPDTIAPTGTEGSIPLKGE